MLTIVIILLIFWHLKAVNVNNEIIKEKDAGNLKWYVKGFYIICGPWTTLSLYNKKEKELSDSERLIKFYEKDLQKRGRWGNDNVKLESVIQRLEEEKLSPDDRKRLRGIIVVDEMKKKYFFDIISILITLIVAAFIGFGVATAQYEAGNSNNSLSIQAAALGALGLITIYVFGLMFLSRRKVKVTIIKTGLDVYERLENKEYMNEEAFT